MMRSRRILNSNHTIDSYIPGHGITRRLFCSIYVRNYRMWDHQAAFALHFRRNIRSRDQNDPPTIRFPVQDASERSVRTETGRFSYRMPQDGRFVREQGFPRTGCLRTVGSYGNRAFPVPDASGLSFRTGTGRFSYQMRQDGQFVRKQGVSRTGCLRTVVSYRNRAFLVPDASGWSVRTETGRFPYQMPQDSRFVREHGFPRTGCGITRRLFCSIYEGNAGCGIIGESICTMRIRREAFRE